MNRAFLRLLALAALFVSYGCSKTGYNPFGKLRDVVDPAGANSSVFLHSSADGTDMVFFGSRNPLTVVPSDKPRPFIAGKVLTDSSTNLFYGTYDLDASGHGTFHIGAAYNFTNQPDLNLAARDGAIRTDFTPTYDYPITVTSTANGVRVEIAYAFGPVVFDYTDIDHVMEAIDTSGATAHYDAYQLFNFALFFSQVRVDSFGSLGMTQYITSPGLFRGLVGGDFTVSVRSLVEPTATLDYHGFEDMTGVWVDGPIVTAVNTMGDGPMHGVIRYEFRRSGNPLDVVLSGTVDYRNIQVRNGIANSGDYVVTIDGIPGEQTVPISSAWTVELTNILPVTP